MTTDPQDAALAELTAAPNYQAWLSGLARPHLGDHALEVGAGLGDYAATWLADGLTAITLTEADPARLEALRERFRSDPRVHVEAIDLLDPPDREYSAMVAFNVFEHIDDHVGALRAAHSLVRSGGEVFILVPAFPFAYSAFDAEIGHFRRYTRAVLRDAMQEAGLIDVQVRYLNAPGLLAWFVGMRLLRMRPVGGAVGLWDKAVVPTVRFIERRWSPPFGQSCIGVARVP